MNSYRAQGKRAQEVKGGGLKSSALRTGGAKLLRGLPMRPRAGPFARIES